MRNASVVPFANPEIMARRFVRGFYPVAVSPASVPGRTAQPAPIFRSVLPSAVSPAGRRAEFDEVGARLPVWLAFKQVFVALWTLVLALRLAGRVVWARHLYRMIKPVLVPQWWLLAGAASWTLTVSFLLTCWAIAAYGG
jgi:hypothetical protein